MLSPSVPNIPSIPAKNGTHLHAAVTDDKLANAKQEVSSPAVLTNSREEQETVMKNPGVAVPQVSIDWFKQFILPSLPDGLDFDMVMKKLHKDRVINNGVWRDLPLEPTTCANVVDVVFATLEAIARSVGEAAQCCFSGARPEPTVVFRCSPRSTASSSKRRNSSRPDLYGLYTKHASYRPTRNRQDAFWEIIVAPGEVKKHSRHDDINDNIQKILRSLSHIMREDPTRRFAVGYTIENASMRLWFTSRSDLLVTAPFNFLHDHETLVHFYLSQIYAKPASLGYDTTIKPASDNQLRARNQWEMTVHHVEPEQQVTPSKPKAVKERPKVTVYQFITTEVLSDVGADDLQGKGTRVWSARQIVDGHIQPTKYVIKDYWVDDNQLREAIIIDKIMSDAPSEKEKEILQRHLLTPFCSGDVLIDNEVDNTCYLLRRGGLVPTDLPPYPLIHQSFAALPDGDLPEDAALAPKGSGIVTPVAPATHVTRTFHEKSHHRVVFLEQAKTVDTLTSMGETIQQLANALFALGTIHQCGWLHGDISSGNLMIFGGVVKIADLEYAKKMSATSAHSERSGTALFMSIEVDHHAYRFRGFELQKKSKRVARLDRYAAYKKRGLAPRAENNSGVSRAKSQLDISHEPPSFRHNPLHDIESLWWLLVYLTLYRQVNIADDTQERRDKQRAFYRPFFYNRDSRRDAFMEAGVFSSGLKYLHPALHPVAHALEDFRRELITRYSDVESGDIDAIDHTVADELVGDLYTDLLELAEAFPKNEDLELMPIRWKHSVEEPAQPAATAVGGVSLDSRLQVIGKKRVLDDSTGAPERNAGNRLTGPEASGSGQSSKRTKHHSRAKADTERNIPARKSRSTSRKRAKSSQSREEMPATLRRSQRIRKSQSAKR